MGENGELIEAQVTDVDAIQLDQQVQQQLQMGKQHIQIDGQQYEIEEQVFLPKNVSITRKSSCVNARGIPPAV